MIKKEFVKLWIADIVPYENNPGKDDEALEDVKQSRGWAGVRGTGW